ncbi:F-box domain [Macleaya cordata]|uniref:F-box domain n=1 Tax=Macleaya cordata TaxID=56857 RepID=A0A200Q906_MACCD|nr:F-box domain [Macleaya cordata]
MEKLHQEITLDIFSRLPVESVLHCRLVCKTWRNLLRLPYFADMHLRRQLLRLEYNNHSHVAPPPPAAAADNLGFLLLTMEKSSPLFYLEYDEDEKSYKTVKRINHPPLKKRIYGIAMVGSCNGLICFTILCRHGIDDPVYICNPITNEYINLPKFNILRDYKGVDININSSYDGRMVSGFGYHPSTNEYKIVRIVYYDKINEPIIGRVQVYTLGDGNGWRNKGEIAYSLIPRKGIPAVLRGILANGALHWLDYDDWKILSFDLEEEEFSLLPSPPFFRPGEYNHFQLRALGGCLCAVQRDTDSYKSLNIWSFKKRSCEWESMFRIPYDANRLPMDVSWPLALTMRGEVLLRYPYQKTLVRYDPKTATVEKLVERVEDLGTDLHLDEAIPHMSSFVSLRALGEFSRRIR